MTTPNIVPPKFNGTQADYRQVKASKDGQANIYVQQVSVPTGTAAGTNVGLIPFNKGMRIAPRASSFNVDALGNGNFSLGYIYDDNVTYTNNVAAFLPATGVATATTLTPTGIGSDFVSLANGWIVANFTGTTSTTTGNITANIVMAYDGVNTAN